MNFILHQEKNSWKQHTIWSQHIIRSNDFTEFLQKYGESKSSQFPHCGSSCCSCQFSVKTHFPEDFNSVNFWWIISLLCCPKYLSSISWRQHVHLSKLIWRKIYDAPRCCCHFQEIFRERQGFFLTVQFISCTFFVTTCPLLQYSIFNALHFVEAMYGWWGTLMYPKSWAWVMTVHLEQFEL